MRAAGNDATVALRSGAKQVDVVEIDPVLMELATEHFGLGELDNVTIHTADARAFLAGTNKQYDLIVLDAYQVPYIPFHLATAEFFALLAEHLRPHGAMMANSLRVRQSPELLQALCATVGTAMPSVYVLDVLPDGEGALDVGNSLVFATRQRSDLGDDLRRNVHLLPMPAGLKKRDQRTFVRARNRVRDKARVCTGGDRVLTDDHAPVDWLVHASFLGFLSGA